MPNVWGTKLATHFLQPGTFRAFCDSKSQVNCYNSSPNHVRSVIYKNFNESHVNACVIWLVHCKCAIESSVLLSATVYISMHTHAHSHAQPHTIWLVEWLNGSEVSVDYIPRMTKPSGFIHVGKVSWTFGPSPDKGHQTHATSYQLSW